VDGGDDNVGFKDGEMEGEVDDDGEMEGREDAEGFMDGADDNVGIEETDGDVDGKADRLGSHSMSIFLGSKYASHKAHTLLSFPPVLKMDNLQ